MTYVQRAFEWLPTLSQARDDEERHSITCFWHEAQRSLVTRLGQDVGPDEEVDGTPYESDGWIIRGVAGTIVQMQPKENPRTLWEPLLALGSAAHYWVEDFLQAWLEVGLSGEQVPERFVAVWREIIAFARDAPMWQVERGRGRAYAAEHHWTLMGLDYLTQHRWEPRHRDLVLEMATEYQEWAAAYLSYPDAADRFIEFLKKESSRPLLDSGLVWLAEAGAASMSGRYRREDEVPRHLAELLDTAWQADPTVLKREPPAKAFRDLLRGLVDRQVPVALALSDRIATR